MSQFEFIEEDCSMQEIYPFIKKIIYNKYDYSQSYMSCILLGLLKIIIRGRLNEMYSRNVLKQLKSLNKDQVPEDLVDSKRYFFEIINAFESSDFTRKQMTQWIINKNDTSEYKIIQVIFPYFKFVSTEKILSSARLNHIIKSEEHSLQDTDLSFIFQAYCNYFIISIDYFDRHNRITQFKSQCQELLPIIYLKSTERFSFLLLEIGRLYLSDFESQTNSLKIANAPFMYDNTLITLDQFTENKTANIDPLKNKPNSYLPNSDIVPTGNVDTSIITEEIKKSTRDTYTKELSPNPCDPVLNLKNSILAELPKLKPKYKFSKIETSPQVHFHDFIDNIPDKIISYRSSSNFSIKSTADILIDYLRRHDTQTQTEMLNELKIPSMSELHSLLTKAFLRCKFCSKKLDRSDFHRFECTQNCMICSKCRKKGIRSLCPKCGRSYSSFEVSSIN